MGAAQSADGGLTGQGASQVKVATRVGGSQWPRLGPPALLVSLRN